MATRPHCTATATDLSALPVLVGAVASSTLQVFVSSVSSGNCGINVQSATRVYLLEPAIDPSTEVQVAGRIHRLGQLKDVLVRRLCFRGTIEERIVELHNAVKAGTVKISSAKFPADVVFRLLTPP